MIKYKILAIFLLISCSSVFAEQTIFQCETKNSKTVQVKLKGNNVSYTFGKNLSNPELSFSVPKNEVELYQIQVGRPQLGDSIDLTNGNIKYSLSNSTVVTTGYTEVNITVYQDMDVLSKIECNKKKPIIDKLSEISPKGFKDNI